jgi:hypothetical protein
MILLTVMPHKKTSTKKLKKQKIEEIKGYENISKHRKKY